MFFTMQTEIFSLSVLLFDMPNRSKKHCVGEIAQKTFAHFVKNPEIK